MISGGDLRPGVKVELDGSPFIVTDFQWVKPGKGGAFMRTKLKNMKTGAIIDRTFRTEEKLPKAEVEDRKVQFLYHDGDVYHFMDTESFDQFTMDEKQLGEASGFLKEEMIISVMSHRGEPIGVVLPTFVELRVTETEPGFRGDTTSGGSKPATLETGATIQVPLFINIGDLLRVDTRTGAYVERA
ncbi:MAG: elongation factor P [bacterium]|uniref:Elongation factor P n=1 Tax=Candidatus Methylomirabilis tolerans TaxID=3123416 RepID=A0AAJ1AM45_9BACT|nr:elongation factor P [Candidatus Methylomirabilis sp.]